MDVIRNISAMKQRAAALRLDGETVGLVPTMGALHEGHLSLVRRAREDNKVVVVSIFVNPTQFAPGEDLDRYPRDFEGDLKKLDALGVDIVFAPEAEEMYVDDRTFVTVEGLSSKLCGLSRPTHFRGVTTIVQKLFNITLPSRAYFGQKDAQQLIIIEKMVADLDVPVEIVPVPTVREPDGLAMSSRNRYLSDAERNDALCLHEALTLADGLLRDGERDAAAIIARIEEVVKSRKTAKIDYIEIVDARTLEPLARVEGGALVAMAVFIGKTRLIDNLLVDL